MISQPSQFPQKSHLQIMVSSELISEECKGSDSVYNDTIRVLSNLKLGKERSQMLVTMDFVGIWVLNIDNDSKESKVDYFHKILDEIDDITLQNGIFYIYTSKIWALFKDGSNDWTLKELFKFDGNRERTFIMQSQGSDYLYLNMSEGHSLHKFRALKLENVQKNMEKFEIELEDALKNYEKNYESDFWS